MAALPTSFTIFESWACALAAPVLSAQIMPTGEIPDGTVVAVVDGKNLTAGEVRAALANMPPEFSSIYQQNPQAAIQNMFVMNHLAAEAEKAKKEAQEVAQKISSLQIKIARPVGEDDRLFGSVTAKDIENAVHAAGVPAFDRKIGRAHV